MRLVCADDYPNGAIGGGGPDGRVVKLRRPDLETTVEVVPASEFKTLEPNATVGGHPTDILVQDGLNDQKHAAAKYVDGDYRVLVSLRGSAADRAELERFVSGLKIRSLYDVGYNKGTAEKVVYDGRWYEGAHLPFTSTPSQAHPGDE